jgi:hypothetical protein
MLLLGSIAKDSRLARGTHIVGTLYAFHETLSSGWNRRRLKSFGVRYEHHFGIEPPEDDVTGAILCDSLSSAPFFRKKGKLFVRPPTMTRKRAVRRDSESGGASELQLSQRNYYEQRKLVAAQQVEQLENRLSTLTDAAKRAASENSKLLNRVAQLEQKLNAAHAAPRFEEADA